MSESVSAGLTIHDNVLRYAELERRDDGDHLLDYGDRDFSFDLTRSILRADGDREQTLRFADTLQDVLQESSARDLRIAVHPPNSYSFFTPISSDVPVRDRQRQLLQQAALVTGVRSSEKLHITSETVRTTQDSEGDPFMWVHVLAVPDAVDERMEEIMSDLPIRQYAWMVTSEAATRVTSRIERTGGSAQEALRPYTLAVGQYSAHTEYTLSRNREWFHAHYAQEAHSSENRAYFAVGFLNRVDVPLNGVGRMYVYGINVDLDDYLSFESIFGREPEVLNPFNAVENRPREIPEDPSSYTPCIGAAMGDYLA